METKAQKSGLKLMGIYVHEDSDKPGVIHQGGSIMLGY
jgi:hypothetical protein